ncbi:hypothetical protein PpBr36_01673 [Pyricularia pennisetigena]|uniref:hypothetical protein n=1 Tax=Pyricularia pennisetigena TaxID=1578925 RepID=UPI00114F881E|nr:hypothetical protein PpBr36_01673 [Pyricularia pennisetigena]TLS29159.1 hypothetical protein PpBr36_01673 [Pyricularia pennisetigena]
MGLKLVVLGHVILVLSTQALLRAMGPSLTPVGLYTIGGGDGGEARRCAVCRGSSLCVLDEEVAWSPLFQERIGRIKRGIEKEGNEKGKPCIDTATVLSQTGDLALRSLSGCNGAALRVKL